VADWSFLTNHARVLLCIAHDPGVRLRDIAARLDITERSAHGIITDLTTAGYVVKHRDGRRNRYQIEANLPLREPVSREPAIGEVLSVLLENNDDPAGRAGLVAASRFGRDPADPADGAGVTGVTTPQAGDPDAPRGRERNDAASGPAAPGDLLAADQGSDGGAGGT
jgi:hypothetical protein